MASAIPTMRSYNKVAAGPEPHRNFIVGLSRSQSRVLADPRMSRIGSTGDRMLSVIRNIAGSTTARDAQAAVYETAVTAGENLHV